MEALVAFVIGLLVACGVYLLLRARTFPVVIGLVLFSYATNLFLFVSGRLRTNEPPLIGATASHTDPLPQALVLTAIVIGFATTALYLVLMIGSRGITGSDHVDGKEHDQ